MPEKYKYKAFISYSHSDEKWATWLHRSLENYKVPKPIVGNETAMGEIPARLAPVFRDRDELPSATNLGELLTQSLADSGTQIVICSPAAAKSRWVNEEILTYKRLGRSNRIFCLIVGGEPWASDKPGQEEQECFPPALRFEMGDDSQLSDLRAEPIAADARLEGDGKANAKLKLISGMLGVGFDALKQREAHRRHQRMLVFTTAAFVGMAITSSLAVTAYLARIEADEQRVRAEAEAETAKQTTNFMVDLFSVSDPSEALGNTITAREILDKGAERIETELADQPEIQATLMDTMGTVYTSLGLYNEAVRLLQTSLDTRKGLSGPESPETAASMDHLGLVLGKRGDFEEAEALYVQALEVKKNAGKAESLEAATSMSGVAEMLMEQGRYAEAEPLYIESLRLRYELLGYEHPDSAENLQDLGFNYFNKGDFEQAVAYLRQAVELRRVLHGDVHPDLALAINDLAWALFELDKIDEAEALHREALEMKKALLGDTHAEVALALNNVAWMLYSRGDIEESEKLTRQAIAVQRKAVGESHPNLALFIGNLAALLYDKGESQAAIEAAREALNIQRKLLHAEHPQIADGAAMLAYWSMQTGNYAEAEALLDECLAIREKVVGASHPDVASALTLKATVQLETGRYADALVTAQTARAILEANFATDHWRVAAAKNVEGAALAGLGNYAEAERLLLQTDKVLAEAPMPGVAEQSQARLAILYAAWGKDDLAQEYSTHQ